MKATEEATLQSGTPRDCKTLTANKKQDIGSSDTSTKSIQLQFAGHVFKKYLITDSHGVGRDGTRARSILHDALPGSDRDVRLRV